MRYLMILEVSQKQAYIFASTKLRENIANSEAICKVTDPEYFELLAKRGNLQFDREQNLVYSGGGHTVLEFDTEEKAKQFAFEVSKAVKQEFHEIELFIRIMKYMDDKRPGENLRLLSEELEKKKSIRKASFHQGTFGVEKADAALRRPVGRVKTKSDGTDAWKMQPEYIPTGFRSITQLDKIGNQKNESSFIAVVHIDGNAMGKRVEKLRKQYEDSDWSSYKAVLRGFSESIDRDFKEAYSEMADEIAEAEKRGLLDELDLKDGSFPVRRIILAGDDVCFVTEGRIGIEAARIFIDKLSRKENRQDHERYTACAGVAIVHRKYPFYKAYEVAEMLCSNAKRYLASFQDKVKDAGGRGSAIDWHIEYGEVMDSLTEVRKMYDTNDGKRLELRPYLISGDRELVMCESVRRYDNFKRFIGLLNRQIREEKISRGKVKELRNALKEGEQAAGYYIESNLLDELALVNRVERKTDVSGIGQGKGMDRELFVDTADGQRRSLLFDAIEIMDTYISLE